MAKPRPKTGSSSKSARPRKSTLSSRMRRVTKDKKAAAAAAAAATKESPSNANPASHPTPGTSNGNSNCKSLRLAPIARTSSHSCSHHNGSSNPGLLMCATAIATATASKTVTGICANSGQQPQQQNSRSYTAARSSEQKNTSDTAEQEDESLLVPPINTGQQGPRQLLSVMQNGSPEVRDAVLNECNLIFECRVCRSMFRSLANFLAHKRLYCVEHACSKMRLFDDRHYTYPSLDETRATIAAAEQDRPKSSLGSSSKSLMPRPQLSESERLAKRARLDVLFHKVNAERASQVASTSSVVPIYKLCPLPTTSLAVQVQLNGEEEPPPGLLPSEEKSPYALSHVRLNSTRRSISEQSENNGKNMNSSPLRDDTSDSGEVEQVDAGGMTIMWKCPLCAIQVTTQKDLRHHISTQHSGGDLIFPCPFCDKFFHRVYNTMRHATTVHEEGGTTLESKKKLREQIIESSYVSLPPALERSLHQPVEVPVSSSSSPPAEQDKNGGSCGLPTAGLDYQAIKLRPRQRSGDSINSEKSNTAKTALVCAHGCGKTFDRTFSLTAHERRCLKDQQKLKLTPLILPPIPEVVTTTESEPPALTNGHGHVASMPGYESPTSSSTSYRSPPSTPTSPRYMTSVTIKSPLRITASPVRRTYTECMPKSCSSLAGHQANNASDRVPYHHRQIDKNKLCMSGSTLEKIRQIINLIDLRCKLCPKVLFMNAHKLINHSVTHVGCSVYKCRGCLFQCTTVSFMESHIRHAHNVSLNDRLFVELEKARTPVVIPAQLSPSPSAGLLELTRDDASPEKQQQLSDKDVASKGDSSKSEGELVLSSSPGSLKISLTRVSSRVGQASPHWSTSSPGSAPRSAISDESNEAEEEEEGEGDVDPQEVVSEPPASDDIYGDKTSAIKDEVKQEIDEEAMDYGQSSSDEAENDQVSQSSQSDSVAIKKEDESEEDEEVQEQDMDEGEDHTRDQDYDDEDELEEGELKDDEDEDEEQFPVLPPLAKVKIHLKANPSVGGYECIDSN